MNEKTVLGICIGCITDDNWTIKPLKTIMGNYRDQELGFCDSHAD